MNTFISVTNIGWFLIFINFINLIPLLTFIMLTKKALIDNPMRKKSNLRIFVSTTEDKRFNVVSFFITWFYLENKWGEKFFLLLSISPLIISLILISIMTDLEWTPYIYISLIISLLVGLSHWEAKKKINMFVQD